ncbi:putative MFS-type transporter C09D4.1-like protein [Leptotrombidium deliense]|uniref:Putative MFS-type transporter C09D4.1-like protein n=1 Tax=Leptotrombidium deliense TaxID=299467 RepID=A0A443SBI2_9ACAR|nr:putative MFS-type transporter C09D4.1-like protein [Leptotrombidium deliense]
MVLICTEKLVQVSYTAVINYVASLLSVFPSTVILNKFGIRVTFIIAALSNAIATILKCFSADPGLFWLTLLAQTFNGISGTFNSPLNVLVSRVWFPTDKVTRASNFSLVFLTIGAMLSSVISVFSVRNSTDHTIVENGLICMFVGQAIISTVILILSVLFFDERPKTPPSLSQANVQLIRSDRTYFYWVKEALNLNFIILLIVAGLDSALRNTLNILLNQNLITILKNELIIGFIGLLLSFSRIISSSIVAYILDLKHNYKTMIYACSGLSFLLFLTFAFSLRLKNEIFIVIAITLLAAALGPNTATFINFSAELTYPVPEGIPNGILLLVMQVNAVILTPVISSLITNYGLIIPNIAQATLMILQ